MVKHVCLSLKKKRLLRALIAFSWAWTPCQPNTARFRDGPGLCGSLMPLSPCWDLLALASYGVMPPAVPAVSLGVCFPTRSDKVCISFLTQVCFFLMHFGYMYLLTTASALAIPCKESSLYLGEGNYPSSPARSQKLPQLWAPHQLQLLIPGLGAD